MKTLSTFLFLLLPSLAQTALSAPAAVSPDGSQPQLAVAPSGLVHVVYGSKKEEAIHHATSADDGKTFADPFKIGSLAELALGMGRGQQIAVAGDSVIITAISHKDGMLHLWRREDGRRAIGKRKRLSTTHPVPRKKCCIPWLRTPTGRSPWYG